MYVFTLSSGLRAPLSTNPMGTRAWLESVITGLGVGVMAAAVPAPANCANLVGSDDNAVATTLDTSVVNIESPTIFNIDASIFTRGFRITSDGGGRLEISSPSSFGFAPVRVAMVRDISKGMI